MDARGGRLYKQPTRTLEDKGDCKRSHTQQNSQHWTNSQWSFFQSAPKKNLDRSFVKRNTCPLPFLSSGCRGVARARLPHTGAHHSVFRQIQCRQWRCFQSPDKQKPNFERVRNKSSSSGPSLYGTLILSQLCLPTCENQKMPELPTACVSRDVECDAAGEHAYFLRICRVHGCRQLGLAGV